jgi:hypothetical protein
MNDFDVSPPSPMNHALVATVDKRLRADARYAAARAACWRALGYSMLIVALGGAAGLACWGYARITDNTVAMDRLSAAIADSLDKVVLHTDGTVKLDSADSQVRLDASGATVKLDAGNSPVRLDPNATVRLDPGKVAAVRLDTSGASVKLDAGSATVGINPGNATIKLDPSAVNALRSTERQLNPPILPPPQVRTVTNFTVFHETEFEQGRVTTGWRFSSNAEEKPSREYCYYERSAGDSQSRRWDLGNNGLALTPAPQSLPVDFATAFAQCVWWRG